MAPLRTRPSISRLGAVQERGISAVSVAADQPETQAHIPGSYQKLQNLLEDIFEEQDSFAAEPSLEDVSNSRFFSGVSSDGAHALLSVDTLNKVARYVSRLQHKKKRQRSKSDGGGIPWDADSILRILKMMEKIMREAEYATPFPDSGRHATGTSASPQKKKKGGKKAADEALAAGDEGTPEVDEADMLELEHILATMSTAASAALCCLVTMATDGLPKQVSRRGVPFADASSSPRTFSPYPC